MEARRAPRVLSTEMTRARRYEIGTVIRYRVRGQREWREGMTENISTSGVLMRTGSPLEPNTAIEMRFFLPVELHGESAAEVFCRGLVVRSSQCADPAGAVSIAARIVHSRFLRQTANADAARESTLSERRLTQQFTSPLKDSQ